MNRRENKTEYEKGLESSQQGGTWRDNPHRPGTLEYYEFEDGRRDGGAKDVGRAPGTPNWA
jgi:hypothetical protein